MLFFFFSSITHQFGLLTSPSISTFLSKKGTSTFDPILCFFLIEAKCTTNVLSLRVNLKLLIIFINFFNFLKRRHFEKIKKVYKYYLTVIYNSFKGGRI